MDDSKKYLQAELTSVEQKISQTESILTDPSLASMAISELVELKKQKAALEKALFDIDKVKEQTDSITNSDVAIIEARAGVGGDEAKIWADDLLRMYSRYAAIKSWKVEVLDEGVLEFKGKGVYSKLKWETGVHRVQRVPETESAGRIHTSTASIVVLPEIAETLIEIHEDELIWEFTTGGGHGGQNVNKVATAVRLTHKPSGIVVQSRQERSQEQNRKIALSLLRSQLWEREEEKKKLQVSDARSAIGRSMRSDKIRTYNYPQNRVTDHRIGKSWYALDRIIEGQLDDVIQDVAVLANPDFEVGESQNEDETV